MIFKPLIALRALEECTLGLKHRIAGEFLVFVVMTSITFTDENANFKELENSDITSSHKLK